MMEMPREKKEFGILCRCYSHARDIDRNILRTRQRKAEARHMFNAVDAGPQGWRRADNFAPVLAYAGGRNLVIRVEK